MDIIKTIFAVIAAFIGVSILIFIVFILMIPTSDSNKCTQVPGKIYVEFSDNISRNEAYAEARKLGITVEPLTERSVQFKPSVFGTARQGSPDEVERRLLEYPEVETVDAGTIVRGEDKGRTSLSVDFKIDVTKAQAETILKKENISEISVHRASVLILDVPLGQEEEFVSQFKELPLVQTAALHRESCRS